MCGIAGFFDPHGRLRATEYAAVADSMAASLVHRGPDDCGSWVDPQSAVALGHRRLSVIDISPRGHQPMVSASGRFVIVYNGEIYNFAALRRQAQNWGATFRGDSDTEVLLAVIERFGVVDALKKMVGMYVFALWDRSEHLLHLGRDRMGEKPLYYGWSGGCFLFGSELKALAAHPAWQANVDRDSLTQLMRHGYIPTPRSIFAGVFKLAQACVLSVNREMAGGRSGFSPQPDVGERCPRSYWSLRTVAEAGVHAREQAPPAAAAAELERRLHQSVRHQMVADVPLGALLSGGIDSSLIVALMQANSDRPIQSFTIGFRESRFDEAGYARAVARHLGTDHTELTVTPTHAREVITHLPTMYDEPFADASQIPTALVSQLARRQVTVALSGDGGDELFGGYDRYFVADSLWRQLRRVPHPLRAGLARVMGLLPRVLQRRVMSLVAHRAQRGIKLDPQAHHYDRMLVLAAMPSAEHLYRHHISFWKSPEEVVIDGREPKTRLHSPWRWIENGKYLDQMMYLDAMTYLPDDILTKVDRASMAASLELRVPLLDHRVVEWAWSMPLASRGGGAVGKGALREILYKYIPKSLVERPKMGFGVPIGDWLRGSLRGWAEELLRESRLRQEGYFHPGPVRRCWQEHLEGKANWQYQLWGVLMFQAWNERRTET